MELFFRLWIPGYVFLLLGFGNAQGQTPLTEWTTAYYMEDSHEVDKDSLLTTLPKLTTTSVVSMPKEERMRAARGEKENVIDEDRTGFDSLTMRAN